MSRRQNPSEFLKQIIGKPVVVKLNSGVDYRGILACLDGFMNIALEQTEEYANGQLQNKTPGVAIWTPFKSAQLMGRDDETTRCPMCKDLMLPLILHEFIENGELYEQIWWTCRSSQKNKCDFPSMITPIDVFWVRRTQEEKFLNTIPPPNFMLLDRHWRYLYPGLFPADPLPSLDPSTLEVPQVRRRRRAIPPPSVASSSTYSSCSSSSSRNSTTSALSPVRQVLIDDSLYSSSIASSPLRQQMAGSSSPHSTGSDIRIEGMEPLMSDSMERLTGPKKVSRTQIGEDVRESTSHSRRVTALTGPRSSNTQGKIQRAPDDERITREIVTGMQSKGKDQLMTDEPIQFFNFVIAKRFVREDFLNELGSTVVKRKLQKHGRKELVQVALKGEDLNYDEIREVVVAPEKPFSELRHYDAEGLHTAISSTSSAYKRRAVAVVAPSRSPSLPVAPSKKSMKLLPEVKDLVREKMEKYKQFCEEERDKSTATGVAEDDRLRELAEFGEEPVAEESRVEEEETQSEVYDPIREHFEANAFQDPHFDPQFDYYGLDSM